MQALTKMEDDMLHAEDKANFPISCKECSSRGLRPVNNARRPFAVICFIIAVYCIGIVRGQDEPLCWVQGTASFLNAVKIGCSTIVIAGQGFAMEQKVVAGMVADLSEHRVRIHKDTTIRGELPYTLWDTAFLKRRISIEPDVTVTLESLFIPHGRQPSATSFGNLDIFSMDKQSTLIYRNLTMVYPLCMPLDIASTYTIQIPRPPGYTDGVQIANRAGPVCFPGVASTPQCFSDSMLLVDLALEGSTLDSSGVRTKAGVILEYNVTYVCREMVSEQCILARLGTTYCVQQAMERYRLNQWETYDFFPYPPSPPFPPWPPSPPSPPPTPPPAPPSPPSPPPPRHPPSPPTPPIYPPPLALLGIAPSAASADTKMVLIVTLSCALGGLAVLAAATVAVLYWRRRRLRRRRSGGGGSGMSAGALMHNGYSKANGMTHGSADDRCISGLGPRPGSQPILLQLDGPHEGEVQVMSGAITAGAYGAGRGGGQPLGSDGAWSGDRQKWAVDGPEGAVGAAAAGSGGPYKMSSGMGGSTSYGQSGCTATGPPSNGFGLCGESLLGNPLLAPQGGKGSSCSSGPVIALNMVLGVDVYASREAVVGRGTYATVLEGHLNGRPVAVKLFHRDALGGASDDVKTLKQEVAILARCQHPNVVTLLGAGSTAAGDEVFLVEELMVSNLARVCHDGEGLPLEQVLSVARDVAAGLAYLHPTVIHRDLKPANVLLDAHGTAKLTDFGLSRLWASTVHTAHPEAGTVQYMAPECFSGSLNSAEDCQAKTPISHHSDIYSFGVLLWEMLSRERPWKGLTSIQVALAVGLQHHRLRMPDSDNKRFHPKLRKLIQQCWDEDPRKRPGAAEIAKRLSLLLQQLHTYGSLSVPCPSSDAAAPATMCGPTSGDASALGSDYSDAGAPSTPRRPISSGSLEPLGPGGPTSPKELGARVVAVTGTATGTGKPVERQPKKG